MKYTSNQKGVLPILVAVLVLVLVAAAGVAIYNFSKSSKKNAAVSPSPSSSPAASVYPTTTPSASPAASDETLITMAVKADIAKRGNIPPSGSKLILRKLQGNYAMVDVSTATGPGYFDLLKKTQNAWGVAFQGQNIDPTTESQLGFPQGFTNTGSFQSTVLFTY